MLWLDYMACLLTETGSSFSSGYIKSQPIMKACFLQLAIFCLTFQRPEIPTQDHQDNEDWTNHWQSLVCHHWMNSLILYRGRRGNSSMCTRVEITSLYPGWTGLQVLWTLCFISLNTHPRQTKMDPTYWLAQDGKIKAFFFYIWNLKLSSGKWVFDLLHRICFYSVRIPTYLH